TWQNTASSGRPISTGDRSNNIGNWIVTEDTTCRGRSRRLRTTHAIDVIGSSIIENAASHVVYQIVRISRRLCGPRVGHRIIFKRTGKFTATAVEGAAAHGVKLPVSREIHAHEADSGTWEILAERPEAARRGSRRRRTRCSTASYEVELTDFRRPAGGTSSREIFIHLPEVHVVDGVNGQIGVIAPATERMCFSTGAVGHDRLALGHLSRRIASQASSITNSRKHAGTRGGIADGRVASSINGDTGHEAPYPVATVVESLLLNSPSREIASCDVKFIPANRARSGGEIHHHRLVRPQCFRAPVVVINHRSHDFITESIQMLGGSLLRNDGETGCVGPRFNVWINCDLSIRSMIRAYTESGISRVGKIDV